jgi:hypothetical protein
MALSTGEQCMTYVATNALPYRALDPITEVIAADLDAFETLRVKLIGFVAVQQLGQMADPGPRRMHIVLDARDLALAAQHRLRPLPAGEERLGLFLGGYRMLLARVELLAGQIVLADLESPDAAEADLYELIARLTDLRTELDALTP